MSYQQMDTPQPFTPSDLHQQAASPPSTQQQHPIHNQPNAPQHSSEPKLQQQ